MKAQWQIRLARKSRRPWLVELVLGSAQLFQCTPSVAGVSGNPTWSLMESAGVHPELRDGVPRHSDVIFSTRSRRPDAPAAAKSFGATRIEWVYSQDATYNKHLKAVAPWLGATINSTWRLSSDSGYAKNFDGATIVHPRMKAWGGEWVTTTHPQTSQALQRAARAAVAAGADSIQVDDPLMQVYAAQMWGGDFNERTLDGFKAFLDKYPNKDLLRRIGLDPSPADYRQWLKTTHNIQTAAEYERKFKELPSTPIWIEYLEQTVLDFYGDLRRHLDAQAGKRVPLSMNLNFLNEPHARNRNFFLAKAADYAIAETDIRSLLELQKRAATLRALGLGWVPSILPRELPQTRVAVALLYGLGGVPLVPWDVYVGNDERGHPKRYFGTADEYADLFRFARAQAEWMDGFEASAVVGVVVPTNRYDTEKTHSLVRRLSERQIPFAFIALDQDQEVANSGGWQRVKVLAATTDGEAFTGREESLLKGTGRILYSYSDMQGELLDALRPFLIGPTSGVRIIPRAIPGDGSRLVLHVIDLTRGSIGAGDPACRRRIGIRQSMLGSHGSISAERKTLDGYDSVKIDSRDKNYLFLSLVGCSLWEQVFLKSSG